MGGTTRIVIENGGWQSGDHSSEYIGDCAAFVFEHDVKNKGNVRKDKAID
jgi:hypothetical protein